MFIHCKTTLHVSGVTAPIIRSIKNVPAASGTGHTTCTATPLQSGLIGTARSHELKKLQFTLVQLGHVSVQLTIIKDSINSCLLKLQLK